MAEIITQNPGSEEVQSPIIAGLTEGLNKISQVLNLEEEKFEDQPMAAVSVDSQLENKNRIYEIPFGKKLWLRTPEPVVKKNGAVIKPTSDSFSIDYIGGSITFSKPLRDEDKITVSASCVKGPSTTLNQISNLLNQTSQKAGTYKGAFDSVSSLESQHPTGKTSDFAVVEKPRPSVFVWNNGKSKWDNTQYQDLSDYYNKSTVDEKLKAKEESIPTGTSNQYFSGEKRWKDLGKAVRDTLLTNFAKGPEVEVNQNDSVFSALQKLQALVSKTFEKNYIDGYGAPTTSTKGKVGQRYINKSTGEWFVCTKSNHPTYTWVAGVAATRKVNGKSLGKDVTITLEELGLRMVKSGDTLDIFYNPPEV